MIASAFSVDLVSTLAAVAVIAGGAWAFSRGGGGTAIASLEAANRVLAARVEALERESLEKDRLIAALQAKTDVSLATADALEPLFQRGEVYERMAEERHLLMMSVMHKLINAVNRNILPEGGQL